MSPEKLTKRQQESGFTLVELLVVILIIGVLAAIAIPAFMNQRKKAGEAALVSDVKNVAIAQETAAISHPDQGGTINVAQLNELVPSISDGTVIGTWYVEGVGFCVVGYNTGSDHEGWRGPDQHNQETYIWYDSALGGLVPASPTAAPTGGACEDPRPQPQAWRYSTGTSWTNGG